MRTAASVVRPVRAFAHGLWRLSSADQRLRRLEEAWRERLPAFLNATVSVAAQGEELRRLKARVEDWEARVTHDDETRPADGMTAATAAAPRPMLRVPAALQPTHVEGARLFADRDSALCALPRGGVVAELGVAFGDFSARMLDALEPRRFDAFDLFGLHHEKQVMGRSSAEIFGDLSHRAFYEHRFSEAIARDQVRVIEGDSSEQLSLQPDESYDVIYIDGPHTYDEVLMDAEVASKKIKPTGYLVFNDYIMYDYSLNAPYGIGHVVNDFCVNRGWRIFYMALHAGMFCDVALIRAPAVKARP